MDYINEIDINQAVIHILDSNGQEPVLNEYALDLDESTYKFIYKHIEKCLNDEELKYAKFNNERKIVKEIVSDYLNGIDDDFINLSKELARQLFTIIKSNAAIPSCDLIVASIATDQGPIIAVLKMDYVKNYTHEINFVDEKIGIGIVPQSAGLPGNGQRIQKAAFIKVIKEEDSYNLMVLDKQKKNSEDDEYGSNYFINSFLGCTVVTNERDMTKNFLKATENWTRKNLSNDACHAEKVRTTVKNKIKEDEEIDVNKLSEELFKETPQIKEDFKTFVTAQGVGDVVSVDKKWAEKKLKRVRLKIDKDIDLYIDEETYGDDKRFEIQRNGDGSINLLIKHVMNYIEK